MTSRRLGRATTLLISGLVALTLTVLPLRAGQNEPLSLRYGIYWAGIQIATLALHHEVEADGYHSDLAIETVGLIEKLVRYRAKTEAVGQLGVDDGLTPVTFRSEYRSRKKERRSIVEFDPESGDVVDVKVTKRGKPDPSRVPKALRKDVIDPLTAFFRLRDHVATAAEGAPFRAAVFDGRRRYDLEAAVTGRDRADVTGHSRPVVRVALTLALVAGADVDDLERAEQGDGRFELELLLSDDRHLLPLQLQVLSGTLAARIELLEDCSGEAGCQLAARDPARG